MMSVPFSRGVVNDTAIDVTMYSDTEENSNSKKIVGGGPADVIVR